MSGNFPSYRHEDNMKNVEMWGLKWENAEVMETDSALII